MKYSMKDISLAIKTLLKDKSLKSAVVFCAPLSNVKQRVKASRRFFGKKADDKTFILTIGKPNYEEREFLRLCKKAKTNPRKVWLRLKKK